MRNLYQCAALAAAVAVSLASCAGTLPATGDPAISSAQIDASTPLELQAKSAIVGDDVELLQGLIDAGLPIDADLGGGLQPLHVAAAAGAVDVVEALLVEGADVNALATDGQTPIVLAATSGGIDAVEALVNADADLELGHMPDGNRALHQAAGVNDVASIVVLVAAGADVHSRGKYGYTPLHQAIFNNKIEAVESLISYGADVNILDDRGTSPLGMATVELWDDIAGVLRAAGATVQS